MITLRFFHYVHLHRKQQTEQCHFDLLRTKTKDAIYGVITFDCLLSNCGAVWIKSYDEIRRQIRDSRSEINFIKANGNKHLDPRGVVCVVVCESYFSLTTY